MPKLGGLGGCSPRKLWSLQFSEIAFDISLYMSKDVLMNIIITSIISVPSILPISPPK